ncbi:Hypothetical protein GLP15_2604 [Giardia lamblia P15]|uniref:Uncharacterized protein n=1 Tax=Giardia intestinalis (strain P15) TaxID=658858 RepID=E1F8T5_GIAIA|nr:Hypothetical protein GLP15_2604 [Giardia lamblia P15]
MLKVSLYPRFIAQYGEDRLSTLLAEAKEELDKLDLKCGLPKDYKHTSIINRFSKDEIVAESMLKSYLCTVSSLPEDAIERLKHQLLPSNIDDNDVRDSESFKEPYLKQK